MSLEVWWDNKINNIQKANFISIHCNEQSEKETKSTIPQTPISKVMKYSGVKVIEKV